MSMINHSLSAYLPADLVPRPALWVRLDAAHTYPVLLVTAPGGYGKTTTVASWLYRRQTVYEDYTSVVWHGITPIDNNLYVFCSALVSKLCTVIERCSMNSADLIAGFVRTRQLLGAQEALAPDLLAAVFSEDIAVLPVRIELVLDDYHDITDASVNAFVQSVLRAMPANLQLLILTRKRLPFSIARLRSQDKLAEISIQELQLSVDESDTLLRSMLGESLPPETLTVIQQHTEGWAAGIRLMGLALRDRLDQTTLCSLLRQGRSIRYVSDYLMDEVLTQQPDDVQLFLLRTSLLMELDESSCAAVIDDEDGTSCSILLDYVVSNGLFVISSTPAGTPAAEVTYRYHTIFRSMLQERLRARFHPSELVAMHRRIAAHMAKVNNIDLALQSWLMGDAPELAAAEIETQMMSLIDAEAWPTLERYLAYLPDSLIEGRPWLLLAKIWICNMFGEFQSMRRLIERLEALLAVEDGNSVDGKNIEEQQMAQLRAALVSARLNYQQFAGPFPALAEAVTLEAAFAVFPANSYMGALNTVLLSWLYSVHGEHERAKTVVTDALQSIGLLPSLAVLRLVHGLLVNTLATGRLNDFMANTPTYYDLATKVGDPIQLTWANALSCYTAYLQNDDALVSIHARAVLEMRHVAPLVPLTVALLQEVRAIRDNADAHWVHGQIIEARKYAQSRGNVSIVATCDAIEAWLGVRAGRVEQGVRWARSVLNPEAPLMLPLPVIQLAWLACMAQSRAAADLLRAQQLAEKLLLQYQRLNNYPMQGIEIGLLLVRIHLAQNNQHAALDLLAELVRMAAPIGLTRPFVDAGASLQPLLQQLAKRPKLASFVKPLLDSKVISTASTLSAAKMCAHAIHTAGALLTPREREILALLIQGMTNHDIAQATWLSANTVRNHLVKIYNKLGVDTRQGAVARALQLNLV